MKCPKHGEALLQTDWLPKPGQDPFLYQYKCPKCEYAVYETHRRQERREEISGRVPDRP
jgi:hypothetical protein